MFQLGNGSIKYHSNRKVNSSRSYKTFVAIPGTFLQNDDSCLWTWRRYHLLFSEAATDVPQLRISPRHTKSWQHLPVMEVPQLAGFTGIVHKNNGLAISIGGKLPSGTNPVELNPDNLRSIKVNIKPSANLLPVSVVLPDNVPFGRVLNKNDVIVVPGKEKLVLKVLDGAKVSTHIPDDPLCHASELIGPCPNSQPQHVHPVE